jgi:hypothetical protein
MLAWIFIGGATATRPSNPLRTNRERLRRAEFWCVGPPLSWNFVKPGHAVPLGIQQRVRPWEPIPCARTVKPRRGSSFTGRSYSCAAAKQPRKGRRLRTCALRESINALDMNLYFLISIPSFPNCLLIACFYTLRAVFQASSTFTMTLAFTHTPASR